MKIPKSVRYFAAIDILDTAYVRESAVYLEHGLDPNGSLPLEAGARGAAEIYGIRTATIFKATGAVALRALGVDALVRSLTDTEFPT